METETLHWVVRVVGWRGGLCKQNGQTTTVMLQDLTRWQPLSTGMSENKLIYRSCEVSRQPSRIWAGNRAFYCLSRFPAFLRECPAFSGFFLQLILSSELTTDNDGHTHSHSVKLHLLINRWWMLIAFLLLQGFWACIAPFNFTAISGHLVSAPLLMVRTYGCKSGSWLPLSNFPFCQLLLFTLQFTVVFKYIQLKVVFFLNDKIAVSFSKIAYYDFDWSLLDIFSTSQFGCYCHPDYSCQLVRFIRQANSSWQAFWW